MFRKIIGKLNVFPHYTDTMLKMLNVITLFLFMFVGSVMPYASAKGAALALNQNPEEQAFSNPIFEEEIHHQATQTFFIRTTVVELSFPHYVGLKPQIDIVDVLKPPLA